MSSKKEEERNEKIIRGLMKLPPNRRCINCNSVGPQYVCTNFWTFVCLSCSGIHREFTHRVKSVSMAKFTKQEVEALQQGGNQRARDIYLKNWDMTRMRLPESSNADKIRDFIRSVYVNKKYAGERSSENTSKDSESIRANESELKRPNSYHSFSQSPPYDYQYEERRYGKNSALAPKRLASDKGYEGKVPSFLFSPGRARERAMFEDRFANESSGSRHSDFSVSSAGDQFRYDTQSPTSQGGFPSPNAAYQSNRHPNARPQRTESSSSIGSLDSNSIPESTSEQQPVQQLASGSQQLVTSPTSQRPPLSGNAVGTRPVLIKSTASSHQPPQQTASSTPDTSIDLFAGFNEHNNTTGLHRTVSDGLVVASSTQPASIRPPTSLNPPTQQPAASTPSFTSIDLFAGFNEQNTAGLNRTVSDGLAVVSSTGPSLVRPAAASFNQLPTQQTSASNPSDTSVDLFSGFNEQNTTGLNRTVSDELAVVSSTGPALVRPAASFNQLPTQQPAAPTPPVTSVDLFAGFNEQSTTGLNRTVSDGLAVTSSTGPASVRPATSFNQLPTQQTSASNPSDTSVDLFSGFNENTTVYTGLAVTSPTEVVPASPSVDLFAGFNNQPSMEVKDDGWANFGFSQQKQVIASSSIQSSPVVASSGSDLTRGMQPPIGQIPVNNADTVPQVPQGVAKASPVNQERFQPWNAFGELSSSGLYATNAQMQMPLPQPSGVTQVAPGTSAQLPLQTTMSPVPAQPQPVDHWFANPLGPNVSPYQGISQDPESSIPNLTNLPTNVMGSMPPQHQQLQELPYQAMQSTNPFDFLDDSDPPSNTFMDMGSIQAALPAQQPAADYYSSGTFHPEHYTQNPISTYPSHFSQGDMQQMSDQVLNAQIPNPSPQGYQSLGSNPFA